MEKIEKVQKSFGSLKVKFENDNLMNLFQKGSSKAIIPKSYNDYKQLIFVNTSGGITSGDKYETNLNLSNSNISITTQAAEKIYSGKGKPAKLDIHFDIRNKSNLFWIPHELILFNECNFKRKIKVNVLNSNLLMCETIIFGRSAMGEVVKDGYFSDSWHIFNNDQLIHAEAINFNSNIDEFINSKATFNKNYAINTIFAVGEEFLNKGKVLKNNLPKKDNVISEISIWDEKLIIRNISENNYYLKFAITEILSYFFDTNLPNIWKL